MSGGGKETPRQKMIGMMYLVLMAMLAMNVSKAIIDAFVTLNNKMEKSLDQVESGNADIASYFESALTTLTSTGAPKTEIERVRKHKNTNDEIRGLTRRFSNFLVHENVSMLTESLKGPGATEKDLVGMKDAHGDDYHLSHTDDNGYVHVHDLSHFPKKDDYDTPTRKFVGPDFQNIAEEGKEIMNRIISYRDSLCILIANHPSDTLEGGKVYQYNFDPALIPQPDFLSTAEEVSKFETEVQGIIDNMVKDNKISDADAAVVRDVIVRMTLPKKVLNHGKEYPWIAAQFDHSPVVAASAIFTSLRSDVLQVETIASQLIKSRVKVATFSFNKIDPLAFSSTSYINQGDSLGLRVMIAAYDSSEAMELRYWIDDTTQIGLPTDQRNSETMQEFKGKAGDELMLSGSVGDHILTGEIAVKEKGVKKWKPWKFNYAVGAPNAAVAAADLQVLYRNWKNKIKVSASGYKPESVKVSCSGCSISSSPDSEGNYTATVSGGRAKTAQIRVSAIDDNGKSVELANETFRIFPLPKPTAYFGGKAGGSIKKLTATAVPKIEAKLGNSPLNVPYSVVEFMLYTTKEGAPVRIRAKGNRISGEMKNAIKRIPKGGNLTFAEIKVKGPSGKVTTLEGGLVLRLN